MLWSIVYMCTSVRIFLCAVNSAMREREGGGGGGERERESLCRYMHVRVCVCAYLCVCVCARMHMCMCLCACTDIQTYLKLIPLARRLYNPQQVPSPAAPRRWRPTSSMATTSSASRRPPSTTWSCKETCCSSPDSTSRSGPRTHWRTHSWSRQRRKPHCMMRRVWWPGLQCLLCYALIIVSGLEIQWGLVRVCVM